MSETPTIAVLHVLAVLLPSMIMIACSRVCNIMLHYGTFVVLRGVVVYGNCEECDVCCVVAVSTHQRRYWAMRPWSCIVGLALLIVATGIGSVTRMCWYAVRLSERIFVSAGSR